MSMSMMQFRDGRADLLNSFEDQTKRLILLGKKEELWPDPWNKG
jgi:hypothetical protein